MNFVWKTGALFSRRACPPCWNAEGRGGQARRLNILSAELIITTRRDKLATAAGSESAVGRVKRKSPGDREIDGTAAPSLHIDHVEESFARTVGPQGCSIGTIAAAGFAPSGGTISARREWLFLAALVLSIFLVYQPAWQGGFIWDDDGHVTKPELRSWQGLYRIWFELGATQQYYPLLHSAFWVEHKLWGDATLGYHLVNILLHAAAAVMVALVLRRLSVPGAYLAAAVFALHPVHVESVAWITEQKNTLSAVFYLAAMLVYLRFDQERKTSLVLRCVGFVRAGPVEQNDGGHAAGGPAGDLLVAAGEVVVAARRLAAGSVFCAGPVGRSVDGLG